MIKLHPNILERDGRKAFAVLPYEEFEKVREELENFEDLKELRAAKAKEGSAPVTPLGSVRKELGV